LKIFATEAREKGRDGEFLEGFNGIFDIPPVKYEGYDLDDLRHAFSSLEKDGSIKYRYESERTSIPLDAYCGNIKIQLYNFQGIQPINSRQGLLEILWNLT